MTVNGKNETRRVEIDPSLFVPADKGVVEDLIVAAANDARTKVEQTVQEQMSRHHRRPAAAAGLQALDDRPEPAMNGPEIERLIQLLARLPGLGPRSARRAALHLIKKRETLMQPLSTALADAARAIRACSVCGNLDTVDPCSICADPKRDAGLICVVEDVGDLWAMERGKIFPGRYHVLGGTLSALDGIGPDELNIAAW